MASIQLSEEAAREVHATLAGRPTSLSRLLSRSEGSGQTASAEWRIPLTSETVHRLEGLRRLASDHGISILPGAPQSLSLAETIFWTDFRDRSKFRNELAMDAWRFAGECLDFLWRYRPSAKNELGPAVEIQSPLLIGAYGGEHVGDAAILGGVVQALSQKRGAREACLFSHRPKHTRNLVSTLSLPLEVTVRPYTLKSIEDALDNSDGVVLAGGPLMDLPRLLVKHWGAASMARQQGKPFLIDRIGLGPFKRRLSRRLARKILALATDISLRTSGAGRDPSLAGLDFEVLRDPAFDYLASRLRLDRLRDIDRRAVDSLLEGADGRRLIGVNLRPIRHDWCPDGEAASKRAYERFVKQIADGMIRLDEASSAPLTYVFFSMNPMQMGSSDLAAAYDLHRLVGGKVDLRVWEGDPTVDGVVYLLRKLDAAVTMRLHASIFALSQGIGVLGVDYYPAMGGKVLELFSDLGREDDVCRIDQFESGWFVRNMRAKLEPAQ